MSTTGIIEIKGKDGTTREYHTVAKRVRDFRADHPEWSIITEVTSAGDQVRVRAEILDNLGRKLATGHAEENRAFGINRTSAVENCETSAVGRCLAMLSYGGSEIASAEEVQAALEAQKEIEVSAYLIDHNRALREHLGAVVNVIDRLDDGDYDAAKEYWGEIPEEDQRALWVATTKGGIFTTEQRRQMKSAEWSEANG